MTWEFKEHVRIEQNDFTKSFYAIVLLTNRTSNESVRLKFRERPSKAEIIGQLKTVLESRNYVAPIADEDLLKTRLEKLSRDGVPTKRVLDKLSEIV